MKNTYQVLTVMLPKLLFIIIILNSAQVLAKPDFSDCEDLTGAAAGLCKAASAQGCSPIDTGRACLKLAERFEHFTGTQPPWLDVQGPNITCSDPVDGAIIDQLPGVGINFQGFVEDPNSVSELFVNDSPVTVDASGAFTAEVSTNWGINFIQLLASDGAGNQSKRTCTFLLSEIWVPDGDTLSSSISLNAQQPVLDDSNRQELDSLADIFYLVLNSQGLSNELNEVLLNSNPFKPESCDAEILGVCTLSSEVIYEDISIPGPNTTSMDLVTGGFRSTSQVDDIGIKIRVQGDFFGIPYETSGWMTFDNAAVDLTSDVKLIDSVPNVSLRMLNSTSVGSISSNFTGLVGGLLNILVDLFEGNIRNTVTASVESFVNNELNDLFDDILVSLGIHNLASNFDVPLLDRTNTVGIGFSADTSTLNVSSTRMLASLGTQFAAIPAHAKPTLGAPIPSGNRLLDVRTSNTLAVTIHDGALNQLLHTLWRAGYFDISLGGGDLSGYVPPEVSLVLDATLPPATRVRNDGRLEVALGAILAYLDYPQLLSQPIESSLSVRGSCVPGLLGDDLLYDQCLVEELYLSLESGSLDATTLVSLELFFTEILNQLLLTVMNDSLPVLPIPGVILPESLSEFVGLPAGVEMGLLNPQMSIVGDHIVLDGNFGLR